MCCNLQTIVVRLNLKMKLLQTAKSYYFHRTCKCLFNFCIGWPFLLPSLEQKSLPTNLIKLVIGDSSYWRGDKVFFTGLQSQHKTVNNCSFEVNKTWLKLTQQKLDLLCSKIFFFFCFQGMHSFHTRKHTLSLAHTYQPVSVQKRE